jgi:hypothetical protein
VLVDITIKVSCIESMRFLHGTSYADLGNILQGISPTGCGKTPTENGQDRRETNVGWEDNVGWETGHAEWEISRREIFYIEFAGSTNRKRE